MRLRWLPVACALMVVLSFPAWSAEHALSVGYGFALWSSDSGIGKIEEGDYTFMQAAYTYEHPLSARWLVLVEPFIAYVNRPVNGVDVGFNLGLKVYPFTEDRSGFFFGMGTGAAYTSVDFVEQGTHLLFILQGSFGYRYKNYFIENRWRHYSNGNTAHPNRSINANIIVLGMYF
ncbi:MAG: hypothetical protein H6Q55_1383 [Deltaproteobacteria bacterium]|nr:hypothetical protein [Deltaproteobacteria bacterium]